jgi:hypothetical protein
MKIQSNNSSGSVSRLADYSNKELDRSRSRQKNLEERAHHYYQDRKSKKKSYRENTNIMLPYQLRQKNEEIKTERKHNETPNTLPPLNNGNVMITLKDSSNNSSSNIKFDVFKESIPITYRHMSNAMNIKSLIDKPTYQRSKEPYENLANLNLNKNPRLTHFETNGLKNKKKNDFKYRKLGDNRTRFTSNKINLVDGRHNRLNLTTDTKVSNIAIKGTFKQQIKNFSLEVHSITGAKNSKEKARNDPITEYQNLNFDIKLNNKGKEIVHNL